MKLETFFNKFDQFADAPDAVAKMRELVLELAVQGSLTSALSSDGTVPSVIEFRENAAALANSLGLRPPRESLEEPEPPFDVPYHWRWMALADIGAAQTGTTPSKADHDAFNGDIPFIKPADILPSSIDYSNESLTRHGAESGSRLAPSGSLLMVCIGTIGKCNLIERECAFNQQINSLTPVAAVDSQYLLVAARSRSFQEAAWKKSSSTTIAILNKGKWLSIPVPLPPLAEQKRIVAKVNELLALCDRLEALQQERETRHVTLARASLARFADAPTSANLTLLFHSSFNIHPSDLRKSILTLAVQGKLVPQDSTDEPAYNLGELDGASFARSLFQIPEGWSWVHLSNLAEINGGFAFKSTAYTEEGTRVIRISDFDEFGFKDHKVVRHPFTPDLQKFTLAECDILMAMTGGTVGKSYFVKSLPEPMVVNQRVATIKASTHVNPSYIDIVIKSEMTQQVIRKAKNSTNDNISMGDIKGFTVPVPPRAEQRRIVAKVEQLMALVDELETQLAASRATAADLLSALLAELTGQHGQVNIPQKPGINSMKKKTERSELLREFSKPSSMCRFVLRRFAMQSGYRSLDEFDCTYHFEQPASSEASPICLVGLNGSGKSNLIEAIADVFCFLELINLPWSSVASASSRYRKNDHRFELEYTIEDAQGERLIHVRKSQKSGVEFVVVTGDSSEEVISPRDRLLLLPRRIIGYSSGLNETVSHPFLRTKTLYSEEVREAAPQEGAESSDSNSVFDTRTLYMDYESNAAIIISNYIFRKPAELAVFNDFTRVAGVASFGLRFNRKRAGKSGSNSIVRLTRELSEALESFTRCAGVDYDPHQIAYSLDFQMNRETVSRFRKEFGSAENIFMAMHKWSLLNALILSDAQRKVYLNSDITKGALERPPSVPPSDRVFNIVDLKLKLSTPDIEIDYSGLSDGEHQFMQVFGTVLLFSEPGTLFLFDEPESHFNPEWRTRFNLILNGLPNACAQEYVISTHSPFVVSGSRMGNVYKFTRIAGTVSCEAVEFETYGASFDVLLKKLFSIDSLIDQSAKSELEEIIKRGEIDEMEAAVDDFAESREKRRLYEALIRIEGKVG